MSPFSELIEFNGVRSPVCWWHTAAGQRGQFWRHGSYRQACSLLVWCSSSETPTVWSRHLWHRHSNRWAASITIVDVAVALCRSLRSSSPSAWPSNPTWDSTVMRRTSPQPATCTSAFCVMCAVLSDVAQTVACSIVASRLDYCKAILCGAPAPTFDKLQCVQNNLARVVCQRCGHTGAKPLLRMLHWLPVRQRVTYMMALLTFKVCATVTPAYFSDLLQTHVPTRDLRSSDAPLLVIPRTHTVYWLGASSLSLCLCFHIWNSLPSHIRLYKTVHWDHRSAQTG